MNQYNPKEIEPKWQAFWEAQGLYKTPTEVTPENKMYILPQLPYPSGSGLHVGHAEVYTACDIYARYQRMIGKKVLQVIGWDSFGLPAENYAIKTNIHPRVSTDTAIDNFRSQIKALGISVDWDREVGSHNADYYKWTQWFFLLMYKQGLAYRKNQNVNWCDSCKTALANEQVTGEGKCERCDTVVVQRPMEQWYLKITDYADKLLEGLDRIDWPEETKMRQRNWIGRSEGAEIDFPVLQTAKNIRVFTTRPDTIFGATYLVVAPEHALVPELQSQIENWDEVQQYIDETKLKTDMDRQTQKEKTGVELKGLKAVNPVSGEEIPLWMADYVFASYGTGAIMAVPAHDERDFEFATKFGLSIKEVVTPYIELTGVEAPQADQQTTKKDVVSVIIKHAQTGKYLLLKWPDNNVYGFVGGAIEKNESPLEATVREIKEETGYENVKVYEKVITHLYGCGFKHRKGVNCCDFDTVYYAEVLNDTQSDLRDEDQGVHELIWLEKDEVTKNITKSHHQFMWDQYIKGDHCFGEPGIAINSDFLNGLTTQEAKKKIIEHLEQREIGTRKVQYKLRDWSVSRQRFWGAPIPMLRNEETGELRPIPEQDLPVILPDDVDFKPTGQSPLMYAESFHAGVEEKYGKGWKREPDTLDTFMCSSWYYYRYLDPKNDGAFASPEALKTWMPVDFYLGGEEHVNGHLLYSRFFTKVLYDAGYITFDEPFTKTRHQGLILGEDNRKMSKRWGNVINPTDVVNEYGADTMRVYEMFMGPLEQTKPWNTDSVKGVRRFFERVWKLQEKVTPNATPSPEAERTVHLTVKKVGEDLANMQYNTAIAKMMELVNALSKEDAILKEHFELFIKILAPFAPHIAEEMWAQQGHTTSVTTEMWPQYDASKIVSSTLTIMVQVNGKIRASLEVDANTSEEDIKAQALAQENVQKFLEGNNPQKIIYVKGKLVSIVV